MSTPTARLSTAGWAERALWALRGAQVRGHGTVSREALAEAIHFPLLVFEGHLDEVLNVVARDEPELVRLVHGRSDGCRHGSHPGCTASTLRDRA